MTQSITDADVLLFESQVHKAYQRGGPVLHGLVRNKPVTNAKSVRFPILGAGVPNQRARHSDVNTMGLQHSHVDISVADWEAFEWLDKLDEFKNNLPLRTDYATTAAMALGRKADDVVIDAMEVGSTQTILHGGTGATFAKWLTLRTTLINNHAAPNEPVFALLSAEQEQFMLTSVSEFKNRDFVEQLPIPGAPMVYRWLGMTLMVYTNLPIDGANVRSLFGWVPSSVGLGINHNIDVSIDWVAQRRSWLVGGEMSLGAGVIDPRGLVEMECQE